MKYPKEWFKGELGDFLDSIVGGGTPSRDEKEYWNGSIPWCTVKDFSKPNRCGTEEYISEKGLKSSSANIIPSGTLITPTRMALGRSIIYNVDVAINQDLKALFPKKELDTTFLYYWFERNKDFIDSLGNGSTVKGISLSELRSLSFTLPPLPEQQKIAVILSKWDELIETQTQLINTKEKQKTSLMQKLLTGEVRFPGFEDEWETVELGKVGQVINGLTYSPDDIHEEGVLVLRSSNVQKRRLAFKDNVYVNVEEGKFNAVQENDILICVRNGSQDLIGKNAIIDKANEGVAFGAFMTIYRSVYNPFFFHLFDTPIYNKEVYKNLGATINSINGSDLKKFKMPFPGVEEQKKITSLLDSMDKEVASLSEELESLKLQKKGLMQQLLTGKIRVKT